MSELGHIVVVGAGLAGLRAAEALRREGYAGRITMVGDEPEPPYDRPPLSKDVLLGKREPDTLALRKPEKMAQLDVELLLGHGVGALDVEARSLELGASSLEFDALILATGAAARRLPDLDGRPNVHTLRTLGDAAALRAALADAQRAVVVGAGFIGSEVAASARTLGLEVTIVELETTPLARALGPSMGAALMRLHEENGTALKLGVTIESADDDTGTLRLSDGTTLQADVVVVGVGVVPNTAWLEGSALEVDNGVVCDASLKAAERIYAIGDVANWPNELFGRRQRVEHWTNAADQARHAVHNLLHGTDTPFLGTNFFWSDQYGHRIQFLGSSVADETVVVQGAPGEGPFLAWYRQGDRLVGALAIDLAGPLMKSKPLIERRASWSEALAESEAWNAA